MPSCRSGFSPPQLLSLSDRLYPPLQEVHGFHAPGTSQGFLLKPLTLLGFTVAIRPARKFQTYSKFAPGRAVGLSLLVIRLAWVFAAIQPHGHGLHSLSDQQSWRPRWRGYRIHFCGISTPTYHFFDFQFLSALRSGFRRPHNTCTISVGASRSRSPDRSGGNQPTKRVAFQLGNVFHLPFLKREHPSGPVADVDT